MTDYDKWFNSLPTEAEARSRGTLEIITFEESKARCTKEYTEEFKDLTIGLAKLIKAGVKPRVNLRIE